VMGRGGARQRQVAPRSGLEVRQRTPAPFTVPPPRNLDPLVIQSATPRYPDTRPTIPTADEDWKSSRPRRFTGSGSTSGTPLAESSPSGAERTASSAGSRHAATETTKLPTNTEWRPASGEFHPPAAVKQTEAEAGKRTPAPAIDRHNSVEGASVAAPSPQR